MLVAGVDPGLAGGLVLLDHGTTIISALRMPTLKLYKKRIVDAETVDDFFLAFTGDIDLVVIELVGAMPRQGATSGFTFGKAAGTVEALALADCGRASVAWVPSSVWKTDLGLTGQDKAAARHKAECLFKWDRHTDRLDLTEPRNEGIAEAALLAYWADTIGLASGKLTRAV